MTTLPIDLDGVEFNFVAAQAFSYDFVVTINDENGDPVDLTGAAIKLCVRQGYADPVLLTLTETSVDSTLDVTPLDGRIAVHFDAADTVNLAAPKNYHYDLRVDGYRKVWGEMRLRPGVTTSA
jgi:hypothetical protein